MDRVVTKKNPVYHLMILMLTLYHALSYISESLPGGQLWVLIPLSIMMVMYVSQYKPVIKVQAGSFFIYIISFLAFCFISRIWAENPQLAIPKINSLIYILIAMIIIVISTYSYNDIDLYLKAIMYGGYIVCVYCFIRYGWRGVMSILNSSSRISNDLLNANTLGMCVSYSIVINIHYIIKENIKIRDLLIIPAILILIASGSRKAILIVVIGCFMLYYFNNYSKNIVKKVGKVLLGILIGVGVVYIATKLPFMQTVTYRFQNLISLLQGNETRSTSTAWIRFAYNRLGIELFLQHPLHGIGIANANIYTNMYYGHDHYLHNNYVELLACGGIIGFLLYYSIWISILFVFIKNRKKRDSDFYICLVLLLVHMIMDYGAVSYYSKETYLLLLLLYMKADSLKKSITVSEQKK